MISRILWFLVAREYPSFILAWHYCHSSSCLPPSTVFTFRRVARYLFTGKPVLRNWSVHDISARKVYPTSGLPRLCVRSYRTFSPLPWKKTFKAVIFCDTFCSRRDGTHLLDGAALYAVRTFLPLFRERWIHHRCASLTNSVSHKFADLVIFYWAIMTHKLNPLIILW